MYIIAEIGQAHEGSLGIAHSFIDALKDTGIDAVKFQTHIAQAESSDEEEFRVNFSYEDSTRYDYWKRMEFEFDQWVGLKQHCDDLGLEFMSSPFSLAAVELLEKLGVNRYKIGSGEVNNLLMLERIGRTGKPVILSSGMSSFKELEASINFLKPFKNELSLMQCTTAYPTAPEQWGLNVIQELKERFCLPVGFSDHSGEIFACLAARSLGAELLEFHVTFDKKMFGPDSKSSLTLNQVEQLCEGLNRIDRALKNPMDKSSTKGFDKLKGIFEKSIALNRTMEEGEEITFDCLEAKKPANQGIPAKDFKQILGKKLSKTVDAWSFLQISDLDD